MNLFRTNLNWAHLEIPKKSGHKRCFVKNNTYIMRAEFFPVFMTLFYARISCGNRKDIKTEVKNDLWLKRLENYNF